MAEVHMTDALQREDTDEDLRPTNHGPTFPFSDLFTTLFNPLNDNKKKPSGPANLRRKYGPHRPSASPQEIRRSIIQRFIARWRKEVGNDIYPAFRLMIPEKDRERAMYGMKEKTIAKLLVRIIKIDKNSEDGFSLLNWKLPGKFRTASVAGDFAARCYEVLKKRATRSGPGDMLIEEVNERLDILSLAQKEDQQMPIMQEFYQRMNSEELMWLIRIILRQMKIGATERTIFNIWHPDAEALYSVSSSLKRICWELTDPGQRLANEQTDVKPLDCLQPQLAQYQAHSFERMLQRLRPTEDDQEFWIEEKLDGERMQLHMVEDASAPSGRRFKFWSRKAKEYTDLYGSHLEDKDSALTQHLKSAFNLAEVRNLILDGEMITWDTELDKIVAFGTLKTATLDTKKNPYAVQRPLMRVFDILYLNDTPLLQWTLRDRRRALERAVKSVHRRLEIHTFTPATTVPVIEDLLRKVIQEGAEGLVVKNPRSRYSLNERNDDWVKVKPEYMTEFGESLDCVVIGGYYGSGRRGGNLSSYLCGLLSDSTNQSQSGSQVDGTICYSFFKVGGGFTSADYQAMRHHTDGKWHKWDTLNPPSCIKLGGGTAKQFEKPDVWIKPEESVVIEAKATSVSLTDQFAKGITLRFPRFKRLRTDKSWREALTVQQFLDLRRQAEQDKQEKQFTVDNSRKRAQTAQKQRPLTIAGVPSSSVAISAHSLRNSDPQLASLLSGMTFHIMSESMPPSPKHSKHEIEVLVKSHGANFTQNRNGGDTVCIADRNLTGVASLVKGGSKTVVRSMWLFDCIAQARVDIRAGRDPMLLPWEGERHTFYVCDEDMDEVAEAVDSFGDSFARDTGLSDGDGEAMEMQQLLDTMLSQDQDDMDTVELLQELQMQQQDADMLPGCIFTSCVVLFIGAGVDVEIGATRVSFADGRLALSVDDESVTHVVVPNSATDIESQLSDIRSTMADRKSGRIAKVVSLAWIEESFRAGTLLDEDRFVVR